MLPGAFMQRQKGVTLIGFIFIAAIVAALGIVAFRAIPIYNEYFTVKKIINNINVDGGEVTPQNVRNQFSLKASADYVSDVKPSDLDITRENGTVVISVSYSRTVPLFANVSLLFDFETSNRK
jgi:Tfp pilus assembly major pilin PilA